MLGTMQRRYCRARAFTLIELLVVISIIIILMGLLFPAFRGAQDQAKKVQAKNDLTQIVTAVNAFYTEYGQYPVPPGGGSDTTFGRSGAANDTLFNELRGTRSIVNTRQIVFITLPDVKDATNPRSGIGTTTGQGQCFDPWGAPYNITIDSDYDNQITNPYGGSANAGPAMLRQGVIAWSLGKNKMQDPDVKAGDDVLSWQ